MVIKMNDNEIISIIAENLYGYESEAEQLGKSRFILLCTDINANPQEVEEIEKIANSFRYSIVKTEDGVELHREYLQSPYAEIIENGMHAPYTGGSGGLVHMPDGTTRQSLVPHQLWGNEIPEYAKQGTSAFKEMDLLQQTLFPNAVKDSVQASHNDFAQIAKSEFLEQVKQVRME